MTSKENHIKKIQEHLDELKDAIDEGIEKKPITIGFHSSACAIELLELYLHTTHKISEGKQLKHNWFKRPTKSQKKETLSDRKVGVDFPDKDKIYQLIYDIEDERSALIYGNPSKHQIDKVLDAFKKLKTLLEEKMEDEGIDIKKS